MEDSKKKLKEIRTQISKALNELEELINTQEIKNIMIRDNEWTESASDSLGHGVLKVRWLLSRITRTIESFPRKKSVKLKKAKGKK